MSATGGVMVKWIVVWAGLWSWCWWRPVGMTTPTQQPSLLPPLKRRPQQPRRPLWATRSGVAKTHDLDRSHADQSQPTFENAEQQASSSGDQSPPDHPRAAGPPTVPDPQRQTRPQLNATSSLSTSNSTPPQPISHLRHNSERDPTRHPKTGSVLGNSTW